MSAWDEKSYEHAEAMSGEYLGALPEQMFEGGARWQREALLADDVIERAVDAAARQWFDSGQSKRLDPGRFRDDGKAWQWEDLTQPDKNAYRAIVGHPVKASLLAALGIEGDEK